MLVDELSPKSVSRGSGVCGLSIGGWLDMIRRANARILLKAVSSELSFADARPVACPGDVEAASIKFH